MQDYQQIEFRGRQFGVQDVIDALAPQISDRRKERINSVLKQRLTSVALGLEDLHHSHNAAACLRTAESVGVHDIVAVELREAYPLPEMSHDPAQSRVNMYANRWVDLHRVEAHRHGEHGVLDDAPDVRLGVRLTHESCKTRNACVSLR